MTKGFVTEYPTRSVEHVVSICPYNTRRSCIGAKFNTIPWFHISLHMCLLATYHKACTMTVRSYQSPYYPIHSNTVRARVSPTGLVLHIHPPVFDAVVLRQPIADLYPDVCTYDGSGDESDGGSEPMHRSSPSLQRTHLDSTQGIA